MRVTTRFAAIALSATILAALPSRADDNPQAHIVGYRCEVLRDGDTPAGMPGSTVMVCQIGDDAEPFGTVRSPLSDPTTTTTLDSLLNLLTTLRDTTRHDAALQRQRKVVRRPTP